MVSNCKRWLRRDARGRLHAKLGLSNGTVELYFTSEWRWNRSPDWTRDWPRQCNRYKCTSSEHVHIIQPDTLDRVIYEAVLCTSSR